MFKLLLATALLIVGTQAAIVQEADCPATSTQRFFISHLMKGKWFEIKRYPSETQLFTSCNTWMWKNVDNSVELRFQGLNAFSSETDRTFTFQTDPSNRAILNYDSGLFGSVQFQVLSTDYINYAVIYTCSEVPLVDLTSQRAWILSRSPNGLGPINTFKVNQVIEQNGLDADLFNRVPQDSCPLSAPYFNRNQEPDGLDS